MAGVAGILDPGLRQREDYEEKVRFFNSFLNNNTDHWKKTISNQLVNEQYRVPIELNELEAAQEGLSNQVLAEPKKFIIPWEDALLAFLRDVDEKMVRSLKQPLKLDIRGAFGRQHVTPRGMTSETIHKLMCVEGIIIKAGLTVPKLVQSIHVRKDDVGDGHVESREHKDWTSFVNSPAAGAMPKLDSENNELVLELGLSIYKDYQKFELQETPEETRSGQIPRRIEVICEGDLSEKAKPGDRVQITGVYQPFPPPLADFTNGVYPARLVATNLTPLKDMTESAFQTDDVRNIKEVAALPNAFKILARSFAPAICGHANPKAGLLLQMIGGTEKNLPNGTHLRGDINVLLIGDPSCGKSQMLRFVMNVAPVAISTTGRGSSGVGLTAAVTRDPGSSDFNLEAGAMVLADRGTICIDEFDKMGINDRVAIHEAMEQQCVTIAKAGMHVTLNARCSVTAAANPVYGSFDPSMDLAKNIGLPDSLLSRFDLVFVVRDLTTEEIDRKIASQVLQQAQMRIGGDSRRGVEQIHSSIMQRRSEADARRPQEATKVWEDTPIGQDGQEPQKVVTTDFLRKYLRYCRRLAPVLSEEAQAEVAEKYVDMRMRFQSGYAELQNPDSNKKPRLAVSTRTLEALIRLATAHAKLKLRKDYVLKEDVVEAYNLMLLAREEEPPKRAAADAGAGNSPDDGPDGPDASPKASPMKRGRKRARDEADSPSISNARVTLLQNIVATAFARSKGKEMLKGDLLETINSSLVAGESPFDEAEFDLGIAKLEIKNKVMTLEDGTVMLVG